MYQVTDPGAKRELMEEAKMLQKSITAITLEEKEKKLKITEDYYTKISGYDEEYSKYMISQIRKMAGNWEYWFGENSVAAEGIKKRLSSLKYFSQTTGLTESQEKEQRDLRLTLNVMEDFQRLQAGMKPDKFREYIKTIAELNTTIAEGDTALRALERTTSNIVDNSAEEALRRLNQLKTGNPRCCKCLGPT